MYEEKKYTLRKMKTLCELHNKEFQIMTQIEEGSKLYAVIIFKSYILISIFGMNFDQMNMIRRVIKTEQKNIQIMCASIHKIESIDDFILSVEPLCIAFAESPSKEMHINCKYLNGYTYDVTLKRIKIPKFKTYIDVTAIKQVG